MYAKVLYNYKPQEAGELRLYAGDTIKDVTKLNKGWCKVNKTFISRSRGELGNAILFVIGKSEWKVWFLSRSLC